MRPSTPRGTGGAALLGAAVMRAGGSSRTGSAGSEASTASTSGGSGIADTSAHDSRDSSVSVAISTGAGAAADTARDGRLRGARGARFLLGMDALLVLVGIALVVVDSHVAPLTALASALLLGRRGECIQHIVRDVEGCAAAEERGGGAEEDGAHGYAAAGAGVGAGVYAWM